jgi:predicted ABC-type ATPase
MRVFAGPNGSGKSTVVKAVRNYIVEEGKKIDFGIYINADDLVNELKSGKFKFSEYEVRTNQKEFAEIVNNSGLINQKFSIEQFSTCHKVSEDSIILKNEAYVEKLSQALADFLRKKLLKERRKFSFETVFSHPSKLDLMYEARDAGYKVYLYFVSTNSLYINKERVSLRVKKGGHFVSPDKIESRYYRSLKLLFDAAQISYQTFFFDNSKDKPILFTHFKQINGIKTWEKVNEKNVPEWFIQYYANKVKRK